MNKKATIFAVLVFIGLSAWLYATKTTMQAPAETNNVEIMKSENNTPIVAEDVAYFEDVQGYFARPEAPGNYPGVVMIHENRGLRPEIREAAETLAKEGYMVLAVNLLDGVAEDQTGARELTAKFNQSTGTANMRAATAFLRAQGAGKIGSLGWCFGGRQSVELAISGEPLDATVVYYGGRMATSTDRLAPIKWPVLGIFGDQDTSIPLEMVETFRTSLNTLGVENEIHIYPGVGHAFANPSGANYAPDATKDAWSKTLTFLEKYLKPSQVKPTGKIDVRVACESALAYTSFASGAEADTFVAECIEGKHPEVIERYVSGLGHDGAAI